MAFSVIDNQEKLYCSAIVEQAHYLRMALLYARILGESLELILKDIDPAKMKVNHPVNFPGLEKLATKDRL